MTADPAPTAPVVVGVVRALGVAPLKGAARQTPSSLAISTGGPAHDRRWCLVEHARDPARARVLRTVENPCLLRLRAAVDAGGRLTVDLPDGTRLAPQGEPGEVVEADYWGRRAALRPLAGPWDEALSAHTGRDVTLAVAPPGEVVWDAPLTLVTTAALAELARRAGVASVDPERFRASVTVQTPPGFPAFVEDGWRGRRLRAGEVELEGTRPVGRCAVVRLRPGSGAREPDDPMRLLAPDRTVDREVVFGTGARVLRPGRVRVGDPVVLLPGPRT